VGKTPLHWSVTDINDITLRNRMTKVGMSTDAQSRDARLSVVLDYKLIEKLLSPMNVAVVDYFCQTPLHHALVETYESDCLYSSLEGCVLNKLSHLKLASQKGFHLILHQITNSYVLRYVYLKKKSN
jgi:hypothetical protein